MSDTPVLLDITRLISRSWTGRRSTGIDRVAYAYARHFRARALAVVQHRGVVRVLDRYASTQMFDLLLGPSEGFRAKLIAKAPQWLMRSVPSEAFAGSNYINVTHTDFDLPEHWDWVRRHDLRATYLIHDLIPILAPQFSRPHAVRRHQGRVDQALRNADTIIVTSRAVAGELRAYAEANGLGTCDPVIAPLAGEALKPAAQPVAPSIPYFLSTGTIEPRKNHALLFDVWRELAAAMGRKAPRLVLVGQSGPMSGDILAPLHYDASLASLIQWRSACSDDELGALMAGASAVLCPSRAEGFGLPLVEALAMGKPVIASDIAVFREIAQGHAQLLAPDDVSAWTRAITARLDEGAQDAEATCSSRFTAPRWSDHFAVVEQALRDDPHFGALSNPSSLAA